jgi:hypothetical protein
MKEKPYDANLLEWFRLRWVATQKWFSTNCKFFEGMIEITIYDIAIILSHLAVFIVFLIQSFVFINNFHIFLSNLSMRM